MYEFLDEIKLLSFSVECFSNWTLCDCQSPWLWYMVVWSLPSYIHFDSDWSQPYSIANKFSHSFVPMFYSSSSFYAHTFSFYNVNKTPPIFVHRRCRSLSPSIILIRQKINKGEQLIFLCARAFINPLVRRETRDPNSFHG